ncbi:VTC domain-containing protein [Novipirellula sp. SH528]|uniref:VTC domain-containing protein n=1 Tax=Novipirellula sp. SH528 TaxID=3454466 RepID=UPI003FA15C5E
MKFSRRYECTFVLNDAATSALIDSASSRFAEPTHCDVSDLYYDAAEWQRPIKTKSVDKEICRVRRIDHAWNVFLEQQKRDKQTTKLRRTVAASSDLKRLESDVVDKTWDGKWFHKHIVKQALQPSLNIQFDRLAMNANSIEGPIRLTVDQNIHCRSHSDLVDPVNVATTQLPMHLVRMKYFVSLPAIFKSLIYEFALLPQRTSMYRQCVLHRPLDQCAAIYHSPSSTEAMSAELMSAAAVTESEVATCQFG